ncbi:hypothetical protein CAC42_3909 [Sphaceloma murrayae]|uniref:ATP-dependent DNA helicase II subunit 2 n=1 Tax=Sphaceloma murrayae TaxID=2082308 RepID=A0A2K1QSP2_9PEZI|nr:hypothetical protein CAC42_3909 [Sphaceloma murrayae]
MASKEATVYIVDVGKSMNVKRNGRDVTDLEWALEYVWDRITSTVATDRKTCHMGVIGLKTDETENELDSEDAYHHISVLCGLGQMLMPDLRILRDKIQPSHTDEGDAVSALVIAIQMIAAHCKALQYIRRIILITNGLSPMDESDISDIAAKIKADRMELLVLGADFDDAEYGFKEERKPSLKAKNESILKDLVEDCGGNYGTLAQAIEELSIPRIKTVKPIPSYKGYLTLGDPEKYDSAMAIDVERYPKVMVASAPSASSFVVRGDMTQTETQPSNGDTTSDGLAGIKRARTYQVPDESAPGGKKDVDEEDLAKGYAYGSTAVYIAESDRTITTFETQPGLSIIGFVAREDYARYMDMSRSNMIIAQRTNPKASLALSSFIHALHELDSLAVARFVSKENRPPLILLLSPSIEPDLECLYDTELPFAEDIRSYRFPPLDRILTVSGKTITQHRNLPSDALQDAMSDYVDALDLTSPLVHGPDETEYAPIEDTFSPILHRINQVIRHRAVHPSSPLPPIPEILTKYSTPPQGLLDKAQPALDNLIATADVKKVPPKTRAKRGRGGKGDVKPLSGLDVEGLLSATNPSSSSTEGDTQGRGGVRRDLGAIDPRNAVPEFKQMVARVDEAGGEIEELRAVYDRMGSVLKGFVARSVGDAKYGMTMEGMRALREEVEGMEDWEWWNGWVRGLKGEVLRGELGGDRREFWARVRRERMGLIAKGKTSEAEREDFLRGMKVEE